MRFKTKFRLGCIALAGAVVLGALGHGNVGLAQVGIGGYAAVDKPPALAAPVNGHPISGTINGKNWRLVQPIVDNYLAFEHDFPGATYDGDIGDDRHQNARTQEDHTPNSVDKYKSCSPKKGWIYGQDLGPGAHFDLTAFARWLLDQLRAGKYPEVKYVITTMPANNGAAGNAYFGMFKRAKGWSHENHAPDHDRHIHISYMMSCGKGFSDMESHPSTIIADYARFLGLPVV